MTVLSSKFLEQIFAVILILEIIVSSIFPPLRHELKTGQAVGKKIPKLINPLLIS